MYSIDDDDDYADEDENIEIRNVHVFNFFFLDMISGWHWDTLKTFLSLVLINLNTYFLCNLDKCDDTKINHWE